MALLKSPGPNGLPPCFFQKNWETIKDAITDFVKNAFPKDEFQTNMNEALISLIPKIEKPVTMINF